eukprot:443830_1
MSLKKVPIQPLKHSTWCFHPSGYLWNFTQRRNMDTPPTPPLLKQLQRPSDTVDRTVAINTPSFGDEDIELFSRTLITPKPFNRYHHLWLHKTLTNEKRIKNLPIPTPNYKKLPTIMCIMHHIINNGPSTLESLWRGLRPFGIVKSKRRLKKTIKRYIEKYEDTLPFVNMNKYSKSTQQTQTSDSDMDSDLDSDIDSGTDSDSDFKIDSDFSDSDSAVSTEWDTDGLQPAIYDLRPEKKDKLIAKYDKRWNKLANDIDLCTHNASLWWYSIHEHGKPVAKGPVSWDELIDRSKTDKKNKGKLNKNKVTNQTPVFNFAYMEYWKLLGDVVKNV